MKRQLIKTGITVTLPIVILIVLFALQDTFIRLGSTRMSRMQNETTAASIADSIQILYNYKTDAIQDCNILFWNSERWVV